MTSVVCLLAVLSAPPTPSLVDEVKVAATELPEQPPLKPFEIRRALHAALKDEATSETFNKRYDATERLCALFYEMMLNDDFPELDRQKWRARLVSRLRSVRDDVEKNLPPETTSYARTEETSSSTSQARGGGAIDQRGADELIDLITTTIAPETWEVHGGNGSIFYYSNLRVLVIRQTEEVHEKIGGINRGLRAGP